MPSASRRSGPAAIPPPRVPPSPSDLALEKVIQDHIPSVSAHLRRLLALLTPSPAEPLSTRSKQSIQVFERDLRRLCHLAQDGVKRMDLELRTIEAGWDVVDKSRWEVCRRDYKGVMKLVHQVWEAGQGRMEELRGVEFADARTRRAVGAAMALRA